jgi:hypothetical protein
MEGLDLVVLDPIQPQVTEGLLQSQVIPLRVVVPGPLVGLGVRQVVLLEERMEGESAAIGLLIAPRIILALRVEAILRLMVGAIYHSC